MNKAQRAKLNRLIMLIMALAMVLILSSCRTRISNNTEVASTITDEDGWLTEMYQERRDELGMPVAKEPFFTGQKEDESYEDYDGYYDDMEDLDEYAEDPWEDEYEDDEDDSDSPDTSTTGSTSSTTQRRTSTHPVRRRTTTTTGKKPSSSSKKKTETPAAPPETPTVSTKYKVSFDGSAADMEFEAVEIDEGTAIGTLPNLPKTFGWFTEDGTEVGSDYIITKDQTIYARKLESEPDPEAITKEWEDFFAVTANSTPEELKNQNCYLQGTDSGDFFNKDEFRVVISNTDSESKYIINFVNGEGAAPDNDPVSDTAAKSIFDSITSESLETVIIIPDSVISGSRQLKAYYKLLLLDLMYGTVGAEKLTEAANALGLDPAALKYGIYQKP